ncbi:hypothetical protein A4X17_05985 [Plantibacter sp. H53]|uniref:hypothetical protein n=1 Tax=Plantibacter sp. H53 TaxID=1827323 RepID=UPI0007D9C30D|nr:hypothetical protein [Plantibacter sp. H53]OAN29123.1 hypothetical protein A4X17_05985 [Plantibacter sp. H53]
MTSNAATKPSATTEATEPAKAPSRKDLLLTLEGAGYTGPTSFTASTLRDVVAWIEAGTPKDSPTIPTGVMHAVHPELKPAPKARAARLTKVQQGYQQALTEVAELTDLASVRAWVAANQIETSA